jgi:parallel beta-helix repeat protein
MITRSPARPARVTVILVLLLVVLALPAGAGAETRFVNPFETCATDPFPSYPTIQAAVDDSDPGDAVGVCPGTYTGSTGIPVPNLTLFAIGHVILTGGVPCVNIIAPGVQVRGFEMTGCDGAIRLVSDDALIENNLLHGNIVAMTVGGSNNRIRNNLVRDNTDSGIEIAGLSPGTVVSNNTVRGNTNAGIHVPAGGEFENPLVVTKNLVQRNGVGIDATFASDVVISFNSATFNGVGIMLTEVMNFLVMRNNASRSDPGPDCVWDGKNPGTVIFQRNNCRTETPPGAWD